MPLSPPEDAIETLVTVRDLVRYALTRFTMAGLVHGHGAGTALDEAAFLVLETLRLPVDDVNPFAEARLTRTERMLIIERIEARVTTRKPAAYIVGAAYIAGHRFLSDERAIVPRSFLGELLADGTLAEGEGVVPAGVGRVLDLCTGGGSLAILAALTYPDAVVEAVDLSPDALALAADNVALHGLADRITLTIGDLFQPLDDRRYDLILTNPPYVDAEAMATLPPEYRHEPALALDGGADGLDLVRRILAGAARHLTETGLLIAEIGEGRARLEADRPDLGFMWLDTAETEGEVFALEASALGAAGPKRGRTRR